jgi:hypothetical protein
MRYTDKKHPQKEGALMELRSFLDLKRHKWGYEDESGNAVIPAQWDMVEKFSGGKGWVQPGARAAALSKI